MLHTWVIHPSGFDHTDIWLSRSQCPRDLRRRSATARLLRLWVRISCECCVLSSSGLCDKLITRRGKSCVAELQLETSRMKWPWPALGLCDKLITRRGKSCVAELQLETSRMKWPWPALRRGVPRGDIYIYIYTQGVRGGTDQTSGECSLR